MAEFAVLLRYFQSAYVQYASFKCLAGLQIQLLLTLRPLVLDVRRLRITPKMNKITWQRRLVPCTLRVSFFNENPLDLYTPMGIIYIYPYMYIIKRKKVTYDHIYEESISQ